VSVPVLHKLQEILKELMVQGESLQLEMLTFPSGGQKKVGLTDVSCSGLTWRDDVTQAIISRELSHVPTVGSASKLHEKTPKQ